MAISNNARGSQPGVCTSTTRPTAPYEGQMIYETDTDLTYIWGGSAWQQVSGGTAVGNSGLVFISSTTAGSGVSSITVSNCFSATYDTYKILYTNGTASVTNTQIGLRLGSTASGYLSLLTYMSWGSGTITGASTNNTQFYWLGGDKTGGGGGTVVMDVQLINPFRTVATICNSPMYGDSTTAGTSYGRLPDTTSYTSFTLFPDGGTISGGNVVVYGYRK